MLALLVIPVLLATTIAFGAQCTAPGFWDTDFCLCGQRECVHLVASELGW